MMRYETEFWFFLALLTIIQAKSKSDPETQVSDSINKFGIDIYMDLIKSTGSDNVLFSPLSIHNILSLTFLGAREKTAQEMASGLHLPSAADVVKIGYQHLLRSDTLKNNTSIQIANKLYVDNEIQVLDKFYKDAMNNFYSEIQKVNMKSPQTADIVNKWIDEKTHHKISKIVSKDDIRDSMVLLVNAMYFSGSWIHKFPEASTSPAPFYTSTVKAKSVPMMYTEEWFLLSQYNEQGFDCLSLEYTNNSSMLIFLPRSNSLVKVEDYLRHVSLQDILANLTRSFRVSVSLPKFKLEMGPLNLKKTLKNLGMNKMFEESAEFGNISKEPVSVAKVLHKSVMDVNEEGTVAADATAFVEMVEISEDIYPESISFIVDHPFVFLIYSQHTHSVLFMGRVYDPQA